MARQSQLSRYGAVSRNIPELAPSAKVFLVGDSDDTTYGVVNLAADFPPDFDGVTRVYSTIQTAVNATAPNRGDVVLVAPNHAEDFNVVDTWASAATQIIGMGQGDRRPALTYNTKTALVNISGDGMRVSNLMFLASADSTALALDLDTGFFGIRVDNCIFTTDAATDDFRVAIRVGSKESVIENNKFLAQDTAGAGRAISLKGGDPDMLVIKDNYIYGQYDTVGDTSNGAAPIAVDTTDTADTNLSGILIQNNTIVNTDTAASLMMRIAGGAYTVRGIARDNYFASYDSATADTSKFVTGLAANNGIRMVNNLIGSADSGTERLVNDSTVAHS